MIDHHSCSRARALFTLDTRFSKVSKSRGRLGTLTARLFLLLLSNFGTGQILFSYRNEPCKCLCDTTGLSTMHGLVGVKPDRWCQVIAFVDPSEEGIGWRRCTFTTSCYGWYRMFVGGHGLTHTTDKDTTEVEVRRQSPAENFQ